MHLGRAELECDFKGEVTATSANISWFGKSYCHNTEEENMSILHVSRWWRCKVDSERGTCHLQTELLENSAPITAGQVISDLAQ